VAQLVWHVKHVLAAVCLFLLVWHVKHVLAAVSVQIILQAEPKHLIKKLGKQMVVLNLHGSTP
jgi:broad-specificity NMP kinase